MQDQKQNIAKEETPKSFSKASLIGDFFGGTAAMLVALPSAIAFGLIIYAPLGPEFSGRAAIGGIIGTIAIGLFAPLFGGTKRLVSAPCAPAAAVLSVFILELTSKGIPKDAIPVYVALVSFLAGIVQITAGKLGGGRFIKYIPYPVVAGYLSGVGVLIFFGQLPKYLGVKGKPNFASVINYLNWESTTIIIGSVTILTMLFAPRLIKAVPAAIVSLFVGIGSYFCLSFFNPSLLSLKDNHYIIGPIAVSLSDLTGIFYSQISSIGLINFHEPAVFIFPVFTLAVLLSIDTLKTCVVLDALTLSRHNSNKELLGQGLGNIASAVFCGIPGAGTMGATLVNLNSGAKTKMSGIFVGLTALFVLILLGNLIAWIPFSALAGILMVVAVRMVDKKSFALLKHKSTHFDFFVILAVIVSAVVFSLITAAGVGIALAIILFLREQIRSSVIRRKVFGNQIFSKKVRISSELNILETKGKNVLVVELQGQLFFGTTDQLFTELEKFLKGTKYIVLDMSRVQSVDFTAVNMLKQILARIKKQDGHLVFASIPFSLPTGQNVKKYLETLDLIETDNLKFFDEIDSALEWIEDENLLEENALMSDKEEITDLADIELFSSLSADAIKAITDCLVEQQYKVGEVIFKRGDQSDEIYFVKKGTVKIILPLEGGSHFHLATFSRGGFFGDMSFLDKGIRSANAFCASESAIWVLSRARFNDLIIKYPEIAGKFFEKLALVISHRLRQSDKELKALQEH